LRGVAVRQGCQGRLALAQVMQLLRWFGPAAGRGLAATGFRSGFAQVPGRP